MEKDFSELLEQCQKITAEMMIAARGDKEKEKYLIAQKIIIYRISHDLSQDKLAEKLLVSKMQIIRWENARCMPSQLAQDKMRQIGIL